MANKCSRSIDDLCKNASKFWPLDLIEKANRENVIPLLLETQDEFISILKINIKSHIQLFQILEASSIWANLFVKHLSVLSDVGGEKLQRYNDNFSEFFPESKLIYYRNGNKITYDFEALPLSTRLTNKKLSIDSKSLYDKHELSPVFKDVIVFLIFGSSAEHEETARNLSKCEIGEYIGKPKDLEEFVKQRYIWVSRITSGAIANTRGDLCQNVVKEYLQKNFPHLDFSRKNIPDIYHSDGKLTTFDIVITDNESKYYAIEVSFQETTNSTIERKAGQAESRFNKLDAKNYRIAYVIDGAGNFQRENAIDTLISNSHLAVAFTESEMDCLSKKIEEYFKK